MQGRDSKTKLFAIIGYPLKRTLSPELYNSAFKYLRYNARYIILRIKTKSLKKEFVRLKESGFSGFNVTIPHKEAVIPLLDGLSYEAREIGAVNTIKVMDGKFIGYNTDAQGFLNSLKDENISFKDKSILCLGSGGAARAVVWALAKKGASKIIIANRTRDRAEKLIRIFKNKFARCEFKVIDFKISSLKEGLKNSYLLINTTSVGNCLLIKPEWLKKDLIVYDIIYKDTPLIKAARQNGLIAINGLGMLVHQAALSFKIWTNKKAPIDIMCKVAIQS